MEFFRLRSTSPDNTVAVKVANDDTDDVASWEPVTSPCRGPAMTRWGWCWWCWGRTRWSLWARCWGPSWCCCCGATTTLHWTVQSHYCPQYCTLCHYCLDNSSIDITTVHDMLSCLSSGEVNVNTICEKCVWLLQDHYVPVAPCLTAMYLQHGNNIITLCGFSSYVPHHYCQPTHLTKTKHLYIDRNIIAKHAQIYI